ncbi:1-hydroxycarotenoid 3,4-desaturase CrtD [Variovorax sp. KK3]|uniref:1-hydroxycarotenoid 3,4-desaturase CrtD n=1 Tax=Variovorax sp. KK3 TaxID=1855728 RepID=UPI00097CADFF|nr:1-hydroxycarotenoid 3,4-desaturase CrtD [Variovorax sp. KK3]
MKDDRVLVVGAGIGGLAAALDLASRGLEVRVLERAPTPGGKLREVEIGGVRMDAGPTVFTMRWVFDELLAHAGARLEDQLSLQRAEVLARHAWDDGSRLDLFADVERSADAIGSFAGADAARGYRAFCDRARQIHDALEHPFLRGARPTPLSLVARAGLRGMPALARISPFGNLWDALGGYFRDPRLQQLFGRYATYCGSSPWLAPATLMLVAHVEQQGVWLVEGGMHRIAQMLARLATERGAHVQYGADVAEILVSGGRATGVRLGDGERIEAGAVVFNGDVAALGRGLLGAPGARAVPAAPRAERSLSALTFNLRAEASGFALLRHSVFFSRDYAAEFDDILRRGRLPTEPTVYVCAQDRSAAHDAPAPEGAERLLCIVNAPASGDIDASDAAGAPHALHPEEVQTCQHRTFDRLSRCGLRLDFQDTQMQATTPQHFDRMFPGTGGALYGQASHGWAASFSRPGARSRLPGLYLAGGSTHPGPGVPMAALSGRRAAESLMADRASTSRSRPAATPGGTSMR